MKQLIASILVVAIFVIAINTPQRQSATAQQQSEQLGKALSVLERDDSQLTLDALRKVTAALEQLNQSVKEQSAELADVERCQQQDANEFRTKLTALETKIREGEAPAEPPAEPTDDITAKLADHEKRIAALEAKLLASTPATYPSVSSVKSAGSTGTVVATSGGSTGTVVQSYGSAGSTVARQEPRPPVVANTVVVQQQPRTPLRTAAAIVTAPIARAGHWSYPGEISNHLANDHGVQTNGMSREQMLDLHDALHEGQATWTQSPTVQSFTPARPPLIQRSVATPTLAPPLPQSNCPGGVCPQPRSILQPRWTPFQNLRRR